MGWYSRGYSESYSRGYGGFAPYVSVAQRKANAAREVKKLEAKGRTISPVKLEGRKIAATFWGEGWCDHMESFRDYENRLPRGRRYVRNGSVVDLQVLPGKITALVAGSSLYTIEIAIKPLPPALWAELKAACSGKIASVLELLKGGVSAAVMEVMTHRETGMFPKPGEIKMECSCPDSAGMCKHIAAVFYGVGARLDREPELLFRLRRADPAELIAQAAGAMTQQVGTRKKVIADEALADVFGIDMEAAGAGGGRGGTEATAGAATVAAGAPAAVAAAEAKGARSARVGSKEKAGAARASAPQASALWPSSARRKGSRTAKSGANAPAGEVVTAWGGAGKKGSVRGSNKVRGTV